MAILCPYCKTTLERDDARFCRNCGKPVPAHSQPVSTPRATTAAQQPPRKQGEQDKPALRVQIVSQPEKGHSSLQEQAIQSAGQEHRGLQEQIARQPAQKQQAIRVQVVKQSEENHQEEIPRQVEPDKPVLHVQVVTSPQKDTPAWQEQVAFQPPPQPRRLSQSEEISEEDKQKNRQEGAHPANLTEVAEVHGDVGNDEANTLRAAQDVPQIKGATQRSDKDAQAENERPALEAKRVEIAPRIPGATRTKPQIDNAVLWPAPMTHVSTTGPVREQNPAPPAPEQKKGLPTPPPRTDAPVRELHVKVWDKNTVGSLASAKTQREAPVSNEVSALDELPTTPPVIQESALPTDEEEPVEDRPTNLLPSTSTEVGASELDKADAAGESHPGDDIEQYDTQHLPSSKSGSSQNAEPAALSIARGNTPQTHSEPDEAVGVEAQSFPATSSDLQRNRAVAEPATAATFKPISGQAWPQNASGIDASQPLENSFLAQPVPANFAVQRNAISYSATPSSPVPAVLRRSKRLPLVLLAALLLALVIIGAGSWIVIAQPFSVAAITQPQVGFRDTGLGLSLLYPNGWQHQKNTDGSAIQFYDSSHTAQVTIAVSNTNTGTQTAYLQKQAAQSGMSGTKNIAASSFAGATWQGLQGSVQQSGANYTCAIFVTAHAGHLVTVTQLAPQSVYATEEQIIFSSMRNSLQFL